MRAAIGILCCENLPLLEGCLQSIWQHNPGVELVVAVDGSSPAVLEYLDDWRIPRITGKRGSASRNRNRLLLWWAMHPNPPDVLVMLEDDAWPVTSDWLHAWTRAAQQYGFCAWGHDHEHRVLTHEPDAQTGRHVAGCVLAVTRDAISRIGYQDPAYYGTSNADSWGYEDTALVRRLTLAHGYAWERGAPTLNYGLRHGDMAQKVSLWTNDEALERNRRIYEAFDGTLFHLPWRDEQERREMEEEIRAVLPSV